MTSTRTHRHDAGRASASTCCDDCRAGTGKFFCGCFFCSATTGLTARSAGQFCCLGDQLASRRRHRHRPARLASVGGLPRMPASVAVYRLRSSASVHAMPAPDYKSISFTQIVTLSTQLSHRVGCRNNAVNVSDDRRTEIARECIADFW